MRRSALPFFVTFGIAIAGATARAEVITYQTTLTVTPGSITYYGDYDEDGTFYPSSPDLFEYPNFWMTPGDRFEVTFTVDTSARLSGYDIPPYGRFYRAQNFVLESSFRPFNTNAGVISQEFVYGPHLTDVASASSTTLFLYSNFVFYPYRSLFISHFDLALDLPIDVAGEGLPIDQLMGPLDGLTPRAGASLGPDWSPAGYIQLQASPLIRTIPVPGAAAMLSCAGLFAARRRR